MCIRDRVCIALFVGVLDAFVPDVTEGLPDGAGTGVGIAAALVPVLLVALRFYRNEHRQLSGRESWLLAVLFTVLGLIVSMVLFLGMMVFNGYGLKYVAQVLAVSSLQFAFVIGVYTFMLILLNKLVLWSSLRAQAKQAARRAAKEDNEG